MAKLNYSHKALLDLRGIWNYTIDKWSEKQADKYYHLLNAACRNISSDPTIGRKYSEVREGILGYSCGKHIVFYKVETDASVTIVRILHQRMDLVSRLDE